MYIVYDNVTATNLCGNVGTALDKVTLSFDPTDVSSVRTVYNSRLNAAGPPIWPTTAVQMNFQDLNGCTINASDINEVINLGSKDLTATTISGTLYRWKPCLPFLDIPISQLDALQPEWSNCVRDEGDIIKGIWDPPIALTAKDGLQAPTTPAAPIQTPAPILEPTTSSRVMIQSSKSNLVMDPPKPTPGPPAPAPPPEPQTPPNIPSNPASSGSSDPNPAPQPQSSITPNTNPAPPRPQNDPGVNPPPRPQDPAPAAPNAPPKLSSNLHPPPSSTITIDNIPLEIHPSGIIVAPNAGQTLKPGNVPITVGSQVISVVDSSVIVAGSSRATVAFPTPVTPGYDGGIGGAIVSIWDGAHGGSSATSSVVPVGGNGTGSGGVDEIMPGSAVTTQVRRWLGSILCVAWSVYFIV